MAYKKLAMTRGDTKSYAIVLKQSDGTPYNIKNWVIHFTLKTHYDLPDSEASLMKVVSTFSDTTSGTSGSANIELLPVDTANLDPGEYDYDIAVTTNLGKVFTLMVGKMELTHDVTRTAGTAGTA